MGASASVMEGGLEGEGPSPPANVGERDNAITSAAKVAEVDVAEIVLLRSGAAAAAPGLPE